MTKQNTTTVNERESLKSQFTASAAAFTQEQDRLLAIKANITRNQNIITALESDNHQAQEEIERIQVSELGEINFDGFDELSERIAKNNRKIDVTRKIIAKLEIQVEYSLLTEYKKHREKVEMLNQKMVRLAFDELMNDFLNSNVMKEINTLYSLFLENKQNLLQLNGASRESLFFALLAEKLSPQLNAERNPLEITIPEIKLSIPAMSGGTAYRQAYIAELEAKLAQ